MQAVQHLHGLRNLHSKKNHQRRLSTSTQRTTLPKNYMFTDKDKFINSKENRNAIRERYGEEMTVWANSLQQEQKPTQNSQQGDEYLNNAPVIESGRKFLEQLRAQGKNAELSLRLQSAIQSGNTSEVENILKQNNVAISSPPAS